VAPPLAELQIIFYLVRNSASRYHSPVKFFLNEFLENKYFGKFCNDLNHYAVETVTFFYNAMFYHTSRHLITLMNLLHIVFYLIHVFKFFNIYF
jgi:hypothetical protein